MILREIAHSRAGDKGNISTISVIAYNQQDYDYIRENVTIQKVTELYRSIGVTKVERYELPQLSALNFVLYNTLGGGVLRSLAIDSHGKSLSGLMLSMNI